MKKEMTPEQEQRLYDILKGSSFTPEETAKLNAQTAELLKTQPVEKDIEYLDFLVEELEEVKATIPEEVRRKIEEAEAALEKQLSTVKEKILQLGEGRKGRYYNFKFNKGRTTWKSDLLEGFALAHPEILVARSQGNPYVSAEKIKVKK